MKTLTTVIVIAGILIFPVIVSAQTTAIIFGGEDTELSPEGIITGNGSSSLGGLGAAALDTFNIYYQPLGEGDFVDNLFPDPEVYSFQMNIPEGLPNYQSQGIHGSFWDSRGRNGEGILPWINRDWRGGEFYDARYRPAGDEAPFGVVSDTVQWTIDYWYVNEDEEICFIHTCLAGMVEEFHYNEDTGDATALLITLQTAYLGYGDDGEPGPGAVEYDGGAYQGFDSFREASGLLDCHTFFFEYDGEANEGSLTPCGTRVKLIGEGGWIKGYYDVIQEAIDTAEDGDTVLVSPGTYEENINFEGEEIIVASLILTTGDRAYIDSTIIDGNRNGSVVEIVSGEGESTEIVGFTLINGEAESGGGVFIDNESTARLRHLIIRENNARNGGAIRAMDSRVTIEDVEIIENEGITGGGICIQSSIISIRNVSISNNTASNARIVFIGRSSGELENVAIFGNHTDEGWHVHLYVVPNLVLRNVTIAGNESERNLNLFIETSNHGSPTHVTILNSIIWDNGERSILMSPEDEDPEEANNRLTIDYCDIQGGVNSIGMQDNGWLNWGDGNINEDPLFVNPDEGDFHLTEDSPCIDAGDPESDPDPDGTRADMGAYYFYQNHIIDVPDDFETIQAAIDAAQNGDTVLVAPGEYIENIDFSGKNIIVASLFFTTGEARYIEETIIDGDSSGSVVSFENGEDEDAILTGFTLRNGYLDRNGGGIKCANSSPTITNCRIHDNHVGTRGGGISCEPNANPMIRDCEIFENTSNSGGAGLWCGENSSPTISGCNVYSNEARWNGGGLNMYIDCNPVVEDCIFEENIANHGGGGIIISQDCSPLISNCQILDNMSVNNGGGITVERNATPVIRNCLLEDNETENERGAAIAVIENGNPVIINCTFDWEPRYGWYTAIYLAGSNACVLNSNLYGLSPLWISFDPDSAASSIMIAYSDIMDGQASIVTNDNGELHWEEGNIDADPLYLDREEGDYRLSEDSPCIDAGTAFFVWEDDTLVNMQDDEYNGEAPDMGAYESDFEGIGSESVVLPSEFKLYQNHPNPFNSLTKLKYELPSTSCAKLAINDINGRLVDVIVDERLNAGRYTAVWNADKMPSGIYLARLEAGSEYRMVKLMLIK